LPPICRLLGILLVRVVPCGRDHHAVDLWTSFGGGDQPPHAANVPLRLPRRAIAASVRGKIARRHAASVWNEIWIAGAIPKPQGISHFGRQRKICFHEHKGELYFENGKGEGNA
jgi:hypothetical protein